MFPTSTPKTSPSFFLTLLLLLPVATTSMWKGTRIEARQVRVGESESQPGSSLGSESELAPGNGPTTTSSSLSSAAQLATDPCLELRSWHTALPPEKTSNHQLVLAAGEGTTGTHAIVQILLQQGLTVGHYDHFFDRPAPTELADDGWAQTNFSATKDEAKWQEWYADMNALSSLLPREIPGFDFRPILDKYEAVTDLPFPELFPYIIRQYPKAKVILSTRDPLTWARKRASDHPTNPLPFQSLTLAAMTEIINGHAQVARPSNAHELTSALLFSVHNTLVACMTPNPSEQLVVVDVFSDGFEASKRKIAEFLVNDDL